MNYFDAHCHVQFDAYESDRNVLLAQMEGEGIGGIVVGVDAPSSQDALNLVEESTSLYASAGHHPNGVPLASFDEAKVRELLINPKVVSVGECGIDYFRPLEVTKEVKDEQRDLFCRHIALAAACKKPLMVHGRPSKGTMDAYDDLVALLREGKQMYGDALTANIHFFVGDITTARSFFELGCTVSYTAVITFARSYDEVIRFAPQDRLLTETDSPYVAPLSRRGQRNDPRSIPEIVRALAEVRGEQEEEVRAQILKTASRVFGITTA